MYVLVDIGRGIGLETCRVGNVFPTCDLLLAKIQIVLLYVNVFYFYIIFGDLNSIFTAYSYTTSWCIISGAIIEAVNDMYVQILFLWSQYALWLFFVPYFGRGYPSLISIKCTAYYINMSAIIHTFGFFCFITKSFRTYSFFPPTPALSTISRPLSSSMCSITLETANVGSSYNRMRGPGIGCWFSDRSNCSHWSLTLTFTLTSEDLSLYTTLLFLLVLYNYLYSNYCRTRCRQSQLRFVLSPLLLHPRLLGTLQSDIPLFK